MATSVAVITGASRGIGKRVAVDLAHAGWDVVCAARSSRGTPSTLPGTVDDTAAAVEREGRRAMPVSLDVQDEEAAAALAERV
jgi:citronellol/citronellal dehydrogenase